VMFRFIFFIGILYWVWDYISLAIIGAGVLIGFWWLLARAFPDPPPQPPRVKLVPPRYPDMTPYWNDRVNRYLESSYMDGWELDDFPAMWAVKDG
jgi:hypothetical protein